MKKMIQCVTGILMLFAGLAFGSQAKPKQLDAQAYLDWYHSDAYPYRDTIRAGKITYVCSWIPYEVEIAKEMLQNSLSKKEAKARYQSVPEDFHFQLALLLPQAGTDIFHYALRDGENSGSRTQYFSFSMKKDLKMKLSAGDSTDCAVLIHERGLSNYPVAKFDIYFPGKPKGKLDEVIYFDRTFSEQPIVFRMKDKLQVKPPRLTI